MGAGRSGWGAVARLGWRRGALVPTLALLLMPDAAPAVTLSTRYLGTVFGIPDRYDYAPSLMRNSLSDPSLVRCWFGGEEWAGLVRVNAGGPTFEDGQGHVWSDQGFSGGETYGTAKPIGGTLEPKLYQTCREGSFTYAFIGLPLGSYVLTLKFAEIAGKGPRERVFDVLVNGGAAGRRDALDVVAEAGGADRALDLRFWAFNTTHLEVSFHARTGEPMISGIEIDMPFLDTVKYAESRSFPAGWSGASVVLCPSEEGADLFENPDYPLCASDYPAGPDRFLVNDPSVVFVDGRYWMYYTAPRLGEPAGTCNQIFLARSTDGRVWTKFPERTEPPRPIVPYSGTCDGTDPFEYGVGEPSVVYREGKFWLFYYQSTGPGDWREMLATSADGVSFTPGVSILPADSTLGLTGGDAKWIPGWNLWLLVGAVRTYPHLFPDPATKGVMRWNVSRDGVHWLPRSYRPAEREFRTARYQNMAPALLGDELGWLGEGQAGSALAVPVVYGAGTADPRTWDLDAMELTLSLEPLAGSLEEITPDLEARGWAYDPDTGTNDAASDGSATGALGFGTEVRAVATNTRTGMLKRGPWQRAELPRCDLVTGGLAPDCYHGFSIDLSGLLSAGKWRVRVEGREFPEGGEKLLPGEKTVSMSPRDRPERDRRQ